MVRDKDFRRLDKFWWFLAFTVGAAAGALMLQFLHAESTFWIIIFLGAIVGAVAIFEQFGDARGRASRVGGGPFRWGVSAAPNQPSPPRKPADNKRQAHRAQLHAITGKKNVEPPSTGS